MPNLQALINIIIFPSLTKVLIPVDFSAKSQWKIHIKFQTRFRKQTHNNTDLLLRYHSLSLIQQCLDSINNYLCLVCQLRIIFISCPKWYWKLYLRRRLLKIFLWRHHRGLCNRWLWLSIGINNDHLLISESNNEGVNVKLVIMSSTSFFKFILQSYKSINLSFLINLSPCGDRQDSSK